MYIPRERVAEQKINARLQSKFLFDWKMQYEFGYKFNFEKANEAQHLRPRLKFMLEHKLMLEVQRV